MTSVIVSRLLYLPLRAARQLAERCGAALPLLHRMEERAGETLKCTDQCSRSTLYLISLPVASSRPGSIHSRGGRSAARDQNPITQMAVPIPSFPKCHMALLNLIRESGNISFLVRACSRTTGREAPVRVAVVGHRLIDQREEVGIVFFERLASVDGVMAYDGHADWRFT